ncbi:hypothetical protein [Actinoplanes sp. NPDC020271]|uniref:hypothetical protein n=1 Tax=Actinoplanes sp. NPDC020271 TaxID=3363896 RepID=UPI00379503D9
MSYPTFDLGLGAQFVYDGDLVEVIEIDQANVLMRRVRDAKSLQATLSTVVRLASFPIKSTAGTDSVSIMFASLTPEERNNLSELAGHIREVINGYRSGDASRAAPGEPRPEYAPSVNATDRYNAKAIELGVSYRTILRHVAKYRESGEAGLIVKKPGSASSVDPRWIAAAKAALRRRISDSTMTISAVLFEVERELEKDPDFNHESLPSQSTAYRQIAELAKGTNAFKGSAKGRREIADRPELPYGRLRASGPGEYIIMDSQDLDIYCMEPVTHRWVKVVLTVALDLWSRCVVGLRLTPVSGKAIDVASVLYECAAGRYQATSLPKEGEFPHHGVPKNIVFTEVVQPESLKCAPETIVIDHGKAFMSDHVISVCVKMGISIQPAQPRTPTDKATVERFFRTLRQGLIQYLPAYKGPDVYSRGERVEENAFYFLHELEDLIRGWITTVYHVGKHRGISIPEWPSLRLSPLEMWHAGIAKQGSLRFLANPHLALEFLPVFPRTLQHYGVEIGKFRYSGGFLRGRANTKSPYGGKLAGKWPIHLNPDDIRFCWIQDPEKKTWHRLDWEHLPMLNTPFCIDSAAYARRLAVASNGSVNEREALKRLLGNFEAGIVSNRAERRMAVRRSAEYKAIPVVIDGDFEVDEGESSEELASSFPAIALGSSDVSILGDDDNDDDFDDNEDDEKEYEILD